MGRFCPNLINSLRISFSISVEAVTIIHSEKGSRLTSDTFAQLRVILVVPVEGSPGDLGDWAEGPAPIERGGVVANEKARASYFDERIERALYGAEGAPVRWNKTVSGESSHEYHGFSPEEIELLSGHTDHFRDSFFILHGTLEHPDPPYALFQLSRLTDDRIEGTRAWVDGLAGAQLRTRTDIKRISTLTFATPNGSLPAPLPDEYADWSITDGWLWLLASATPYEQFPPPPEAQREIEASTLNMSKDWAALVLRDGIAFLGRRRDLGEQDPFYRSAELYFHSIYLDAALLGMLQRSLLVGMANDLSALVDPASSPRAVCALEKRLSAFRNIYWWSHLSGHGNANDLNLAYGRQHRLPELCNQIVEELSTYSQQVRTSAAERSNSLLAVITLIGLPAGLVFGVFQTLELKSSYLLAGAIALSIAATILFVRLVAPDFLMPLEKDRAEGGG